MKRLIGNIVLLCVAWFAFVKITKMTAGEKKQLRDKVVGLLIG